MVLSLALEIICRDIKCMLKTKGHEHLYYFSASSCLVTRGHPFLDLSHSCIAPGAVIALH